MKEKLIIGGIVLSLIIGMAAYLQKDTVTVQTVIRELAAASPDKYQRQFFYEGFESGGVGTSVSSTTVPASITFAISDLAGNDYIELTPTIGAITMTFPATTTVGFGNILGNEIGSKHVIEIYNATTTTDSDSVITFACGDGCDLQKDESESVTLNGLEVARATMIRKADSDYLLWIELGSK